MTLTLSSAFGQASDRQGVMLAGTTIWVMSSGR